MASAKAQKNSSDGFISIFPHLNSFFIPLLLPHAKYHSDLWHGQANSYSYFCNLKIFPVTIIILKLQSIWGNINSLFFPLIVFHLNIDIRYTYQSRQLFPLVCLSNLGDGSYSRTIFCYDLGKLT